MPCCPFPITRTLFLLKTELCTAFERAASAFLLQAATAPCRELRTWSALPAPQQNQQKCFSRLSPSERLDQLVWEDLSALLTEPEQVTQALERAHGGAWLPQELPARQESLRRGQASLVQQLERLTEAYLAGVVLLEEYRRRRSDLERRCQVLEEQQRQLIAPVDRREELAGLSRSMEDFCQRIRHGLEQASFEQ